MYSWARWIGFRVWNPTTLRHPRARNSALVSAGVRGYALKSSWRGSRGTRTRPPGEGAPASGAVGGADPPPAPPADPLHVVVRERKGHRDGPRDPVRKVHRLQDRAVLGLALEPRERREGAHREHLEVGQLASADPHLGKVNGLAGHPAPLGLRHE